MVESKLEALLQRASLPVKIRAEGESPRVAAAQLANWLARALDDTPIGWRRNGLEQALADARAFNEQTTT
jgi:hypothetical protein